MVRPFHIYPPFDLYQELIPSFLPGYFFLGKVKKGLKVKVS